jgi:hypothetical protein
VKIFPKWCWNDLSGNLIGIRRISGLEDEIYEDKDKLVSLLMNKFIECKYPEYVHRKKLMCDLELLGD